MSEQTPRPATDLDEAPNGDAAPWADGADQVDAAAWGAEEDDEQEGDAPAVHSLEGFEDDEEDDDEGDDEPAGDEDEDADPVALAAALATSRPEPAPAAPVAAEVDDEPVVDPVAEFKAQLRRAPGEWYVIHSYAGYENRVKANLENRSRIVAMSFCEPRSW